MRIDTPHSSTAKLFTAGNYAAVAMIGSSDEWRTYAALGLIGKTPEAIDGLSRFDHPQARFYSAVASWIGGDEVKAIEGLKKIAMPHAKNLLGLIRKPKIKVLTQLPWRREGTQDLLTGMARESKFQVQNISFHPKDLPNEPYANIQKFYNRRLPPDFYLCQMVEWHVIPPNIQELPCPIIGQTADYDLHIQAVYPWLQLFDEMVVCDRDEWKDVRRLVSAPVSTFPKSFCVPNQMPSVFRGHREIDFFLSGTVKSPYNPDKARLLNQILRMPDIKSMLFQGFLDSAHYWRRLAHSKITCTYVRRPGSTPTRGLEALSMGCALIVQKGSVLTLFVGENEGVLTYTDVSDLPQAIHRILRHWPDFEDRARHGAQIIRREFSPSAAGGQYLRFATFLAAKPRGSRRKAQVGNLDQRRMVQWKGWLPSHEAAKVFSNLRQANLSRWQAQLMGLNPRLVNLICREVFLDMDPKKVHIAVSPRQHQLISRMLHLYEKCAARFPRALVLCFNSIRNALHFGSPEEVSRALLVAQKIISSPAANWQVDVFDDLFTWDYCNSFFNFRRYTDLVTQHLLTGKPVKADLINLILASLHYYLGHYTSRIKDFQMAATLDPDFPFYRLSYAQALIRRGEAEDLATAIDLLSDLAENSILDLEAYNLLLDLQEQGLFDKQKAIQIRALIMGMQESIYIAEPIVSSAPLQPALFEI